MNSNSRRLMRSISNLMQRWKRPRTKTNSKTISRHSTEVRNLLHDPRVAEIRNNFTDPANALGWQLWVKGCLHDYVGITTGVLQIADDLTHRPSRQSRAKTDRGFLQREKQFWPTCTVRSVACTRVWRFRAITELPRRVGINFSFWFGGSVS